MYQPIEIANYFLSAHSDDLKMTPMKIIKLVYIAHGWHLGLDKGPLINEQPEAWKFGPVIPSLYYRFKNFRDSKITDIPQDVPVNEQLSLFLEEVWDVYGKYNGLELSAKTHQPGTPWSQVWNKAVNDPFKFNLAIPDELIKTHYQKLAVA